MVEDLDFKEGAWPRARRDTAAGTKSGWFWFFDTVLGIVVTTATLLSLLRWGPGNVWILAGVPSAVLILWLLNGVLLMFVWHLFWAPYRQRDEARTALAGQPADEVDEVIANLSDECKDFLVHQRRLLIKGAGPLDVREDCITEFRMHGMIDINYVDQGQDFATGQQLPTTVLYTLNPFGNRVLKEILDRETR